MTRTTKWLHLTLAAAALGLCSPALRADEQKNQGGQQQTAQGIQDTDKNAQDERKTRQLKAFDLEHREPQQIQQLLMLRAQGARQPLAGQPGAQPALPFGAPQPADPAQAGTAKDRLAIAVDPQSKVLFVRGTEEQISEVEQLVEALDKPQEELKAQEVGDLRLIPVNRESAPRVAATLGQLQLQHQLVQFGEVSFVVLCTSDGEKDQAQQAEEVISRLDAGKKSAKEGDGDRGQDESNGDK